MGINRKVPVLEGINIVLCAICFIIIVMGTQKYGPGVTHDSVAYLFSASSLVSGQGLQYFGYTSPFIQWPPLFSIILAVPESLGMDPMVFSQFFNALVMALALWVGSRTVGRLARHSLMPTLFILMGLASFQLLRMSFYVWSEPLFILMTTSVFHLLLTCDFNSPKSVKPLIVMGVWSAIACLTRYIGVVVVAVACLFLLVRIQGIKRKIGRVFLYGTLSVLPTVIYIIRNYWVSGTLVGMRSPSGISLSTNIQRAVKTIAGWLFPVVRDTEPLSQVVLALLIVTAVILALLVITRMVRDKDKRPALLALSLFCASYSFYMALSASKVAFDPVSDRYMIPVMVPLITLLVISFDSVLSPLLHSGRAHRKILDIGAGVVFSVFIAFFVATNAMVLRSSTLKAIQEGAGGFSSDYWHKHAFLSQSSLYEDSDMIYSNDPSAVHFLTGKPSHFPPKTFGIPMYGYEAFLKESGSYKKQVMVWFGQEASTIVYTPQMLSEDFILTELYRSEAVTLYTLERRGV